METFIGSTRSRNKCAASMSVDNNEDGDTATKINCGIWVTLDLILSKREANNIWDKYEPLFTRCGGGKKKDRARSRFSHEHIQSMQ